MPHADLQMRELGGTGKSHQAKTLSGLDLLAGLDRNRTALQMAVLGLETVRVRDDHGVASLTPLDPGLAAQRDLAFRLAVPHRAHRAIGHGQHWQALLHVAVRDPEVGARVLVIGKRTTSVVRILLRRVMVRVVLHHAQRGPGAVQGQLHGKSPGPGWQDNERHQQKSHQPRKVQADHARLHAVHSGTN